MHGGKADPIGIEILMSARTHFYLINSEGSQLCRVNGISSVKVVMQEQFISACKAECR